MNTCTWVGCSQQAVHVHRDAKDEDWCQLCEQHEQAMNAALDRKRTHELFDVWKNAQGIPSGGRRPVCIVAE